MVKSTPSADINVKSTSYFKDEETDLNYFKNWVSQLEKTNARTYERYTLSTSLGKTNVWGLNTQQNHPDTLVIFPGARTTSLIWDFDRGLDNLKHTMKIYLIETNGLPNLSDGNTPEIHSLDYGWWATEVLNGLHIDRAFVAGASFGGLICMKLGIVSPERVNAAFLLNPGCLQPFSLKLKNLYYNLLPLLRPSESNVLTFLEQAVFYKPNHRLSPTAEKMLVDYEVFAITRYKDKTQKPYYMDRQLADVTVDTYLLEGDKDLLFPHKKSIANAKKHIKSLKEVVVFPDVGHGIETYDKALNFIGKIILKS
ncbi:alpha/beta fold hydrolase [Spirosoma luteum]|uniref:alpha/beta fold hydrolase n=1 Tax=Spirosoma luteum TaxID=431553 RepID=UPI00035D40AB|nr:alpha/beta hydrolase [Spirosoma luteum]